MQRHPLNRARIFRFYEDIQAKSFYLENKAIFDKFFKIGQKYKFDIGKFVYYSIMVEKLADLTQIFSMKTLKRYAEWLKRHQQYKSIVKSFVSSAKNIAGDCLKNGYSDCVPYIREMIKRGRLSDNYISGRISSYYLASINRFRDIYPKLDKVAKETLSGVYFMSDKYRTDLQDAFLACYNLRVSPVTFTNDLIRKKLKGE